MIRQPVSCQHSQRETIVLLLSKTVLTRSMYELHIFHQLFGPLLCTFNVCMAHLNQTQLNVPRYMHV